MADGRLCIVTCSYLHYEVAALGLEHERPWLDLVQIPSRCFAPVSWEELGGLIPSPLEYRKILLVGSSCLQPLAAPPERCSNITPVVVGQCLALLAGEWTLAEYRRRGAYLVSSGWLAHWREHLEGWGLDAVSAPTYFADAARSVVHLDTGVRDDSAKNLSDFASFVGLPGDSVPVGLDLLRARLEGLADGWRMESLLAQERSLLQASRKRNAEYALSYDLLTRIVQATGKDGVVGEILQLYVTLFAAAEVAFVPLADGAPGPVTRLGAELHRNLPREAVELQESHRLLPSGAGFQLKVMLEGEVLGMISIDGVALPHCLEEYLALALETVAVCGVVLDNSRSFENLRSISRRLTEGEEALEQANRLLEQRVAERTAQLEASLREQETFSYSVSHDLRAPLRHINSYSAFLEEEGGDFLTEQVKFYLDRIRLSSSTMGKLIDDLLELSRVGRSLLQTEKVDLSKMALAVAGTLMETEPGREVEFKIAPEMRACADPVLINQVLENLLRNSWKYTGGRKGSVIEFGIGLGEDAPFFVRDNGVGFDMAYRDKLFTPFQRLHGAEFEGNGIGLATVKRIIERHGGRVWAEGCVDQGATVYFTLS